MEMENISSIYQSKRCKVFFHVTGEATRQNEEYIGHFEKFLREYGNAMDIAGNRIKNDFHSFVNAYVSSHDKTLCIETAAPSVGPSPKVKSYDFKWVPDENKFYFLEIQVDERFTPELIGPKLIKNAEKLAEKLGSEKIIIKNIMNPRNFGFWSRKGYDIVDGDFNFKNAVKKLTI